MSLQATPAPLFSPPRIGTSSSTQSTTAIPSTPQAGVNHASRCADFCNRSIAPTVEHRILLSGVDHKSVGISPPCNPTPPSIRSACLLTVDVTTLHSLFANQCSPNHAIRCPLSTNPQSSCPSSPGLQQSTSSTASGCTIDCEHSSRFRHCGLQNVIVSLLRSF